MKISQAIKLCLDYHEANSQKKIHSSVTNSFLLNSKLSLDKELSTQLPKITFYRFLIA